MLFDARRRVTAPVLGAMDDARERTRRHTAVIESLISVKNGVFYKHEDVRRQTRGRSFVSDDRRCGCFESRRRGIGISSKNSCAVARKPQGDDSLYFFSNTFLYSSGDAQSCAAATLSGESLFGSPRSD